MTTIGSRVDAALNATLTLAAEIEGEIVQLEKQITERRRELGRLVAGTQRVFAGRSDGSPADA